VKFHMEHSLPNMVHSPATPVHIAHISQSILEDDMAKVFDKMSENEMAPFVQLQTLDRV